MDIWEILGITYTLDKKSIREAYAARSREIHPEENPEEFRQLHKAYQAALGYAEFMEKRDWADDGDTEPDSEKQQKNVRKSQEGQWYEKILHSAKGPSIVVVLAFCILRVCLSGDGGSASPFIVVVLLAYTIRWLGGRQE